MAESQKIYTIEQIAAEIGAELVLKENADVKITGISTLVGATETQVSFLSNDKYIAQLPETKACAVILSKENSESCPVNALVMADPYLGFAKAAHLFDTTPSLAVGINEQASVHASADIGADSAISAFVSIAENVKIGQNCQLHPGCVIGPNVVIGDNVILCPNVTIYHGVKIGNRCIIHSSAVIGSDGFGLANDRGQWVKIPQLGAVVLEDDVEIGASTTIDRGALDDTRICKGVKIDNQIQIGHNVLIKDHTAMAGGSVVAGSSTIGRYCLIGGLTAINGHIEIADQVMITGSSAVGKSIDEPGVYSSSIPANRKEKWYRTLANLNRLDKLFKKLKRLEEKINGSK